MKSGILLFLSAVLCVVQQGVCQICYTCLTQGNSPETSGNLTGCGTTRCHLYGGCAKLMLSALSDKNETIYYTYRDCGKDANRCGPIRPANLDEHGALKIILRARHSDNINYDGQACDCNKELCNSAPSTSMTSGCFLLILGGMLHYFLH